MGKYFRKLSFIFQIFVFTCLGVIYLFSQLPAEWAIGIVSFFAVSFLIWATNSLFFKPDKYVDSRGYVVLRKFNELEHRYIAKQILKRGLFRNEVVHHINGKKTDNSVGNLCLMDGEKHEHFQSWLMWKKKKSGKYPSFGDQKRILESEYGGTLLENYTRKSESEKGRANA